MTDPGNVTVRPATVADAAAMVGMHARAWQVAYAELLPRPIIDAVVEEQPRREARWRARLADPTHPGGALVAERDGRVVGLAFWAPSADDDASHGTAEVQALYLDPAAIGQGIGRTLLAAVVAAIVAAGFADATLWVLDTNRRARRFYEAAGWHPDGAAKTDRRPGGTLHEVRYRIALGGAARR